MRVSSLLAVSIVVVTSAAPLSPTTDTHDFCSPGYHTACNPGKDFDCCLDPLNLATCTPNTSVPSDGLLGYWGNNVYCPNGCQLGSDGVGSCTWRIVNDVHNNEIKEQMC